MIISMIKFILKIELYSSDKLIEVGIQISTVIYAHLSGSIDIIMVYFIGSWKLMCVQSTYCILFS